MGYFKITVSYCIVSYCKSYSTNLNFCPPLTDYSRTYSVRDCLSCVDFQKHYVCADGQSYNEEPHNTSAITTMTTALVSNITEVSVVVSACYREHSLLYLLLCFGTVWLGLAIFHFTKTYVHQS